MSLKEVQPIADSQKNHTLLLSSYSRISCMSYEVKWREVAQSCPTLCDPMDCSPPGSSIHGIFQARVLEWGAIAFSGATTITESFFSRG